MREKLCTDYFAFVEHDWLNWSNDNTTHKDGDNELGFTVRVRV